MTDPMTAPKAGPETIDDAALDAVAGGYKPQPVIVKSWSTSGDADDRPTKEVAFYYNKI